MWKECKVTMLPTGDISGIWSNKGRRLYFNQANFNDPDDVTRYHLYITSDDDVEADDWYLSVHDDKPYKSTYNRGKVKNGKIIATTDSSLIEESRLMRECYPSTIGQPSQQFIEKYVEEYNKSNQITEVLVEYNYKKSYGLQLKINSNNTISIRLQEPVTQNIVDQAMEAVSKDVQDPKCVRDGRVSKIKDNWNREEVEKLLYRCIVEHDPEPFDLDIRSWIKENL